MPGGTPEPPRSVPVEDYAQLIGRALGVLGIGSCVAVGHSMGTQFALELALQRTVAAAA